MSIYASIFSIEDERQWVAELKAGGIDAGIIRDGGPTADDLDAPIIYQGSHVLPADSDPRGGSVHLALVPSHITRDGRDDKAEDEAPWPYLRLDVCAHETTYQGGGAAPVVLTTRQAVRLRDALTEWLDEVRVGGREGEQ